MHITVHSFALLPSCSHYVPSLFSFTRFLLVHRSATPERFHFTVLIDGEAGEPDAEANATYAESTPRYVDVTASFASSNSAHRS
jgi:hypothetical protein